MKYMMKMKYKHNDKKKNYKKQSEKEIIVR